MLETMLIQNKNDSLSHARSSFNQTSSCLNKRRSEHTSSDLSQIASWSLQHQCPFNMVLYHKGLTNHAWDEQVDCIGWKVEQTIFDVVTIDHEKECSAVKSIIQRDAYFKLCVMFISSSAGE